MHVQQSPAVRLARSGSPRCANFFKIFAKFSSIFGSFCQFLNMFGPVRTHSDPFGPVRMRSDAFGCVRMTWKAFRRFRKILDFCRFFEVSGHCRACPDLIESPRSYLLQNQAPLQSLTLRKYFRKGPCRQRKRFENIFVMVRAGRKNTTKMFS